MFFRSERLFLRPGWPEDWNELFGGIADEAVVRNLARAPWPYRAEDARDFAAREQDRRYPHFFITLPTGEGARLIGCVGLAPGEGGTELGYWIARNYWNRGYATEACRAVINLAPTIGHSRIVASHFIDNPASRKVLRKVGFAPTGRIAPRFCVARGMDVPAALHALELGKPSDCDGGDDRPVVRMRAA